MTALQVRITDGGRADAGFTGKRDAGDCVTRAIAIALELPYRQVYDDLAEANVEFGRTRRSRAAQRARKRGRTARNGVCDEVWKPYLEGKGWIGVPLKKPGISATAHLAYGELPLMDSDRPAERRLIARVSGHICAVIDGAVHDNDDPTRDGTRMVYGVWVPEGLHDDVLAFRRATLGW